MCCCFCTKEASQHKVRSGWLQFRKWHNFLPTGPGRGLASLVTASADTLRKSALSAHLPGTLLYFFSFFFYLALTDLWVKKTNEKNFVSGKSRIATSCDP